MPVDAKPAPTGGTCLLFVETLLGEPAEDPPVQRVRVVPEEERGAHQQLWTSHFATCPAAAHHRGRGKESAT